jgi:protein tyrosine/serine phosphatase
MKNTELAFHNFRDIAKFNPKIKEGVIYRSSVFFLLQNQPQLDTALKEDHISTIIDLRADRELQDLNYNKELKSSFEIIHAPFDPWNQSIQFKNTYNTGTNVEIAYHFFSIECKPSIKKVVEAVLNSTGATNIHCHAGKDRTGIIVTLFHLLSGVSESEIFSDYLASKMDCKKSYLQISLDTIDHTGGIRAYLKSCDLTEIQIDNLTQKLCK